MNTTRIASRHARLPEAERTSIVSCGAALDDVSVAADRRLVSGTIARAAANANGYILVPAGFDTSYFPTQVRSVYYDHAYGTIPIGVNRSLELRDDGSMYATTYIRRGPFQDDLLAAIEEGAVRGLSVGIVPIESREPTPEEERTYGRAKTIVLRARLIEYSITPMPADPQALIDLVQRNHIRRESAVLMGLPDTPQRRVWAVCHVRHVWPLVPGRPGH